MTVRPVGEPESWDQFYEIASDAHGHVWAVGRRVTVTPSPKSDMVNPLIGYWDGQSWRTKAIRIRGDSEAVAITADGQVWANAQHARWSSRQDSRIVTGTIVTGTRLDDLHEVPRPHVEPGFAIWDIAATSDRRVWLLGSAGRVPRLYVRNENGWRKVARQLPRHIDIERGPDGKLWALAGAESDTILRGLPNRMEETPLPPLDDPSIEGLTLTRDGNALAFGHEGGYLDHPRPLLLRWTGKRWVRFPTPPVKIEASIESAGANSLTDIWVFINGGRNPSKLAHWDGTNWDSIPRPRDLPPTKLALAGTDLWFLGGMIRYRCL
jgi:hypothetical protein